MPPVELDESDSIVSIESLQFMPTDDKEQQCWKRRSIYRVPAHFTKVNRKAYWPQVVSFGPYHHGEDHLLPMEEHKRRALRHFVKRSRKPLKCFYESLREVAWELEESYDVLDPKWKAGSGKNQFLELMITDGCFMLEILRFRDPEVDDYAANDPIFSNHGMLNIMYYIEQDMLMLENQLPLLVLDRLVAIESDGKKDNEFINMLILKSWFPSGSIERVGNCLHVLDVVRKGKLMEPQKKDKVESNFRNKIIQLATRLREHGIWFKNSKRMGKCLHVLDVFRKGMLMEPEKEDKVKSNFSSEVIMSAIGLREHGINFDHSKTNSLKDISFAGGVLRLPSIQVHDSTESMFLNLIAFERFHVGAGHEVMSYIFFMDDIIDDERDVALLCTQGIIQNLLESNEAAAKMFNSLAKGVLFDPNCSFNDVHKKVNKYCNKRWNKWRANLIHTYFRNPWVILSLIAAVFLFALTIIQTVYAVLSHNKCTLCLSVQ